jgi:hypothetical protein
MLIDQIRGAAPRRPDAVHPVPAQAARPAAAVTGVGAS